MLSITVDQVWWCTSVVPALEVEGPGGDPQPLSELERGCVLAVWSDSVSTALLYRPECHSPWNLGKALKHPSRTLQWLLYHLWRGVRQGAGFPVKYSWLEPWVLTCIPGT